jgi:hypothetical protein
VKLIRALTGQDFRSQCQPLLESRVGFASRQAALAADPGFAPALQWNLRRWAAAAQALDEMAF